MRKPLFFVSSSLLSIGLLAGCNLNDDPTGVNNRNVNTEDVQYKKNDAVDPGNIRYDMEPYKYNNFRDNGYNRGMFNGDQDLIDYDNQEPDLGEEPNEDRNGNGLFNMNNRGDNVEYDREINGRGNTLRTKMTE